MPKPRKMNPKGTGMKAVKAQINQIQKDSSPIIGCHAVASQPPALRRSRDVWSPRRIRIYVASTGKGVPTIGMLIQQFGIKTEEIALKITGIKAWNVTSVAQSTNYIFVETSTDLTVTSVSAESDDYGNGSSLPGVGFRIPPLLSRSIFAKADSVTAICNILPSPHVETVTNSQSYLLDISVMINTSADE